MKFKNIFLILFYSFTSFVFSSDPIAYVYYIDGDSYIKNNKVHLQYKKTISGREVYSGDIIKVNNDSKCSIYFNDEKTKLIVEQNSRVQIIETELSKEIKIEKGSVYLHNLLDSNKKVYILTNNNQFFVESDRVWIYSDFLSGDKLYSLDNSINVYNKINKRSLIYDERIVHYYFNSGKIVFSSVIDKMIPQYVINKMDDSIYEVTGISLNKYDLIPIYGDRIRDNIDQSLMKYSYSFGSLMLNDDTYYNFGFYPRYKHNNLSFGFNLDPSFSTEGELLEGDWDDGFDIIDRIYVNYFHANHSKNNEMYLYLGQSNDISIGHGYLVNNLNNNLDYPRLRKTGLFLKYKFDDDFMNFEISIPDFSDFLYSGGVIATRSSLFLSHKFPITLGLGLVADLNQFSSLEDQYQISFNKKRSVYGIEFDFYYEMLKFNKINISMYGEVVGMWYPNPVYYVLFDNANNVSNDLRYRNGVWGINAPGIHLDFKNRLKIKLAYNHNSALFIPSYFNSNYLIHRTRYYSGALDYPMVDQQIDLLSTYEIEANSDKYMIPSDLYPLLLQNKGFSAHQVRGFTSEIDYNIRSYFNFNISSTIYVEDSEASNMYYSLETIFRIKDNFIRGISFLDLYYSNIFFSSMSDKERLTFGLNLGVKLPYRLSLIFDVGQLYYNSNLTDNNLDQMTNTNIRLGYNY